MLPADDSRACLRTCKILDWLCPAPSYGSLPAGIPLVALLPVHTFDGWNGETPSQWSDSGIIIKVEPGKGPTEATSTQYKSLSLVQRSLELLC